MYRSKEKTAKLASIFVGAPKTLGDKTAENPLDREWTTAIFKERVTGSIYVGKTNLVGDQQADMKHHGGPEKAIFSYPAEHYTHWQTELSTSTIAPGGMGENFSSIDMLEADVSIGDTYEIGEAIIQVSQPRQPCWKPARRYRTKELAILLQNTGRTGWYYRVLQEGVIEAGQSLELVERPHPEWTVAACNHLMHQDRENFEQIEKLLTVDSLASNWRTTFQNRLENQVAENIDRRVYGPNVDL